MTVIELPDDLGTRLKAKAAEQGLTLEAWFKTLVPAEHRLSKPNKSAYGLLAKYGPGPSEEEIDENRREMFRGFAEDAP